MRKLDFYAVHGMAVLIKLRELELQRIIVRLREAKCSRSLPSTFFHEAPNAFICLLTAAFAVLA